MFQTLPVVVTHLPNLRERQHQILHQMNDDKSELGQLVPHSTDLVTYRETHPKYERW
jgi:hypothetical protein